MTKPIISATPARGGFEVHLVNFDGPFDLLLSLISKHEMEITDVNNAYIGEETMTFSFLKGWWTDAGTFESLLRAANLVEATRRVEAPEAAGTTDGGKA